MSKQIDDNRARFRAIFNEHKSGAHIGISGVRIKYKHDGKDVSTIHDLLGFEPVYSRDYAYMCLERSIGMSCYGNAPELLAKALTREEFLSLFKTKRKVKYV